MANIFDYLDEEDEGNRSISVITPTAGNSSSGGNIFDFLDELPDTTTPTTRREPLISMDNLRSSHASTDAPIQQDEPNYKAAWIKGTLGSLAGRALTPLAEKITGKEVDLSTLPEQKTLGEEAVSFAGNMGSDLPLWLSGDAVLAKPLAALSKTAPIAKATSFLPKALTPALSTGVRAGATYGGVIAPVETAMEGDGLQGLIEREKKVPVMALGGSLLHGGGQLAGKGIGEVGNILADRRLGQIAQPLDEAVQNAFKKPSLRDAKTQQYENIFADTSKPITTEQPVNIRQPLSSQGLTDAELISQKQSDYQSVFGDPLNNYKIKQTIKPGQRAHEVRQAELESTFKDLPIGSTETPATLNTLQGNIDKSLGINNPTGSYDGLEAFMKSGESMKFNLTANEQKAFNELEQGIKDAQEFLGSDKLINEFSGSNFTKEAQFDNIKHYTGIDLPKLITNWEKSQIKPKSSLTPETLRMGRAAGVIPPLKPREYLQSTVEQQPQRMGLSGNLPVDNPPPIRPNISLKPRELKGPQTMESIPTERILPERPEPLTWTNREGIPSVSNADPIRAQLRDAPAKIPTLGDSVAPIGEPINSLGNRSAATSIESPTSTMRLKGPDTVKDFPQGDIPAGLKERGVSENIRTDANRPDALRDSYSVDPLVYKQLGNKETLAKAQSIFDKGLEPAISELDTLIKDLKPEAAPLVKMLADKLTNEGNVVRARELMSNAANRATESGQFGQAFRILRDADPETFLMSFDKMLKKLNKEGLDTYGKKWKEVDLTPDELTMVGNIERGNQASYDSAFEQIQARIADEMPATSMEKINAWRHISMLLNVKSNVRNVGGNAIMMAMRKAAQRTSGVIQKTFLKESDRTQSVLVNKEYKDLAKEYFSSNSKELLGGENKFQEGISLNMPDKRVFRKSRIGEVLGKDVDILEKTRKFNYALLQKGDTPFFRKAYEDRLASYAQAKKIKDFSELPQEAFDIAKKEAMEATYKDSSIIADFLNKAKRPDKDAGIARKAGAVLTEAVIPFAKTPLNVLKRGLQFSPIGVANGLGSIKSSKGAAAAIDELAKGLTGTSVLGLGYLLASKGVLTGKVSKDADVRAYDSSTGHSPFSVMGKYSFDWGAPLSIPLSVGVQIYNAVKDNPEDKAKMDSVVQGNNLDKLGKLAANASEAILDGMNASGDTVFNMSVFKGVKLLLGSQQGVMEGLSQLPQNYATQFIPTALNQIAGSVDPLVRQAYVKGDIPQSFKNALISRVPLASKKLPAKQTPFGEDVKKIENPIGRAFSQFLSPGIITKDQGIDPKIDAELRRLNDVEGLKTQFPTMVPNYIEKTQTHPRITLTPEEAIQYQKRVGELTLNSFKKIMNNSSYVGARKTKLQSPDEVKAKLLADAISESKALAKKEILKGKGLK